MRSKTKILIAGIGGVGGYFGGLLAKRFYKSAEVEVCFLARGKHLQAIKDKSLKIIKGRFEFIATPHLASDDPNEIGIANFIIICTKTYDLNSIIDQLKPCIDKNTIILPLLNGVDACEKIKTLLPLNTVLNGCVYIVSRLKEAGVIENSGNIETLYFGVDGTPGQELLAYETLFKQAGIEATLSQNISSVVWEKFIFISPTATATSYFNNCIGEIVADEQKLNIFKLLVEEVKQIALKKNIALSTDISEKTLTKLKKLPFETTSSLHSDIKSNKSQTELEALTGYVISEALKNSMSCPTYEMIYKDLLK
ncbi:MAG: 2-dehydropantoate 2-reductase [Sphingobacteriaceae bacterium]|nr:2-dehydropantoate 2-reductase [Sphingobacteriaceae bacterium]